MTHSSNPTQVEGFRRWISPLRRLNVMPTFVLTEWTFRALAIASLAHAARTNNLRLWLSALVCGTFNDAIFIALSNNFWQAQGCVNLTPRMPLYILEMYASLMYVATVAVRRRFPQASNGMMTEAVLVGLMSHLFYTPYDVNGTRHLWWTWSDSDPALAERHGGVPVGCTLWILSYTAVHAAVNRWVGAVESSVLPAVVARRENVRAALTKLFALSPSRTQTMIGLLESGAAWVDGIHQRLARGGSEWRRLAFSAVIATPLFVTWIGTIQLASLDAVGRPGRRSYRFALIAYLFWALSKARAGGTFAAPSNAVAEADHKLLRWICAFQAVQVAISLFGRPESHISTGVHEPFAGDGLERKPKTRTDVTGNYKFSEAVTCDPLDPRRPVGSCKNDYRFVPTSAKGTYDRNGWRVIPPSVEEGDEAHSWYSIVGIGRGATFWERANVLGFALASTACYAWCLGG